MLHATDVCDGAGDLTVALWRFASLRLAPVSIRMCSLGFSQKYLTCTLVSPRPEGGANGGILAKTSLFLLSELPSPTPQRLPVAIATVIDDMTKTIVARATLRAKCAIQKAAHRGEHSWLGK